MNIIYKLAHIQIDRQYPLKHVLIISLLVLLFTTISCNNHSADSEENEIWVYIDPIQCLSNPWEQEWLENHNNDFDAYNQLSEAEKQTVFVDYYGDLGIDIYDFYKTEPYESACSACVCPTGERYHCLIDESDQQSLIDL